ncbi:MAG: 4a-hydroxytetrahydrobiopterin dehydratase [Gemmataceae bacterium]
MSDTRPKLKVYAPDEATAEVAARGLTGWYVEAGWLKRKFNTENWPTTLMLVNAVGYLCEAADHHADLAVTYAKLWVKLQTHSAGGITDKDFELARRIEDTILWKPSGGALGGNPGKWVRGGSPGGGG